MSLAHENNRFLGISLGNEEFALPLLSVREVIAMTDITPVPYAPTAYLGIMNLRGQVISVLDLRQKLGIKGTGISDASIVICNLGAHCVGLVVDSINSVMGIGADKISPAPVAHGNKAAAFVAGVYLKEKQLVLLLDLAKVLDISSHKRAA